MSKFTGSTWKVSRRLGYSISETGKELIKRKYAPGQHGAKRKKLSEYALQQAEKQKVRFTYGVSEKQFRKTFNEAGKAEGKHGVNFLKLLEVRLDNLVYRLGFAMTRRGARQLVNHGHILVNGKKVDIPSYTCKPGDVISFREKSNNLTVVNQALEATLNVVPFVSLDKEKKEGKFARLPERDEIARDIQDSLIVEFYNRKL